jgi:glycosidase
VFYQIFVRSFADATTGPLAGDGIGDLRGLIERLDTLNDGDPETFDDLGVTALWLLPIHPSPSYHGYDVTDYTAINPQYGTMDDLRELLAACHARGIRVIIDFVLNHCSSQHPWFQSAIDPASDTHDWFVWRREPLTGPGAPNHTVWHDRQTQHHGLLYYGFFFHGMPDFNLHAPGATRALHEASRFWLADVGVDGLRLDAIKHLIEDGVIFENTADTIAWLNTYRAAMRDAAPQAFLVGEVWASTEQVQRYIPGGVDSAFEFDLAFTIAKAVNDADAAPLSTAISAAMDAYGDGIYASFIGNHDMDRVLDRLGGSIAGAKAAASVLLTMPGVPFIYYGEDIGMRGTKPDPDLRTPYQWTGEPRSGGFSSAEPWRPLNADTPRVNRASQLDDPTSLHALYRRLIRLRTASPALSRGSFSPVAASSMHVLAFERTLGQQRALVIINLSTETIHDVTIVAGPAWSEGPLREAQTYLPIPLRPIDQPWTPVSQLEPGSVTVIEQGTPVRAE